MKHWETLVFIRILLLCVKKCLGRFSIENPAINFGLSQKGMRVIRFMILETYTFNSSLRPLSLHSKISFPGELFVLEFFNGFQEKFE